MIKIIKTDQATGEEVDVTSSLIQAIANKKNHDANAQAWQLLKEIITSLDPPLQYLPLVFAVNRETTYEVSFLMALYNRILETIKGNDCLKFHESYNVSSKNPNGGDNE